MRFFPTRNPATASPHTGTPGRKTTPSTTSSRNNISAPPTPPATPLHQHLQRLQHPPRAPPTARPTPPAPSTPPAATRTLPSMTKPTSSPPSLTLPWPLALCSATIWDHFGPPSPTTPSLAPSSCPNRPLARLSATPPCASLDWPTAITTTPRPCIHLLYHCYANYHLPSATNGVHHRMVQLRAHETCRSLAPGKGREYSPALNHRDNRGAPDHHRSTRGLVHLQQCRRLTNRPRRRHAHLVRHTTSPSHHHHPRGPLHPHQCSRLTNYTHQHRSAPQRSATPTTTTTTTTSCLPRRPAPLQGHVFSRGLAT
jgi:hypothetical protein